VKGFGLIRCFLFAALAAAGLSPLARAEDSPEMVYDIFQRDGCLTVLLDLSPYITSRAVERLEDGVDLLIHASLKLEVPRRIWGSREVAESAFITKISYRPLTEEFLLESTVQSDTLPRHFLSLASLYAHLRDSVECCLAEVDSLDSRSRHQVALKVTTIGLTDLNPGIVEESEEGDGSPIGYLFRQFLNLTGYGRKDYSAVSRPFSLSELESAPARP